MLSFFKTIRIAVLSAVFVPSVMMAQQQQDDTDSLVRLDYAKSAQLIEIDNQNIRKVIGPAQFMHNNTYMICDTALWNIDTQIIDAMGNVSIIQEGTVLTSDKMKYLIDEDLAQFRGTLVQLEDSDHNTLRTRYLDYNTKDSVGVFDNGGSMRDKDGQIIESIHGTYDSKIKLFTFTDDVNMFTDSIFIKTSYLEYRSDINFATFSRGTDAWKDEDMLSSESGWYDRDREVFFFKQNVHVMTDTQEGWSDSLYFYRYTSDVDMRGHAQVTDTSRNASALAGKMVYIDSIATLTLTRNPVLVGRMEDEEKIDTVYFGADTIICYTLRMCDVDSIALANSAKRLEDLDADPVATYRRKAAEAAAKAAEEAMKDDPNYRPPEMVNAANEVEEKSSKKEEKSAADDSPPDEIPDIQDDVEPTNPRDSVPPAMSDSLAVSLDSLSVGVDSLSFGVDSLCAELDSLRFGLDSLGLELDSLAVADSLMMEPLDTTKINFIRGLRNIKLYRDGMQAVCDSLEYTDLDSLVRMYKDPFIWNEINQQYSADSVTIVIRNNNMEKANLMSDAYIVIEEEPELYYNQIKSTEVLAFFEDNELTRFDALGTASGMFFLREDDVVATVNKTESQMLSATFLSGEVERVYYFDKAKSDAYPVVQLPKAEQTYKGFNWQPNLRPADRTAITTQELRAPQREKYNSRPRAAFKQTDIYFPGYISDIYLQISTRDSLQRIRAYEQQVAQEEQRMLEEKMLADSLAREQEIADSLALVAFADSLALADSMAVVDSIALIQKQIIADSLARADSIRAAIEAARIPTKEELRAKAIAEREARQQERIDAREARWAELDRRDAEKAAAKQAKKDAKEREKKRKYLTKQAGKTDKEDNLLEKYVSKIEKDEAKSKNSPPKTNSRPVKKSSSKNKGAPPDISADMDESVGDIEQEILSDENVTEDEDVIENNESAEGEDETIRTD